MKKYFVLLMICITLFGITSCDGCDSDITYSDLDAVVYEKLLSLPGKYIVVAHQTNCPNCEKLLPVIQKYYRYAQKNDDAMPIYAININEKINKDILLLSSESYPTNMIGTKDYTKVRVKATPSIMVISNGKLTKVISDYNTQTPVTDGTSYLEKLMS